MRLSMWQLAAWLEKYDPIIRIQEGEAVIRNVRFLSEERNLSPISVYIGSMKEYTDETEGQRRYIICTNRKDMLLLRKGNVHDVFNDLLDVFEYYNGWSDDLLEKIHLGCSLDQVLELSSPLINGALMVCDSGYMVRSKYNIEGISSAKNKEEMMKTGIMPLESILSINDDPRIRKRLEYSYVMNYESLEQPCICKNLFLRNEHVGWVIAIVNTIEETGIHVRQIVDEIGNLIEAWLNLNEEQQVLASSGELFRTIIEDQYQDREAEERKLISIGWYPSDPKEISFIRLSDRQYSLKEMLRRKIEYTLKGCVFIDQQTHFSVIRNKKLSPDYLFYRTMRNLLIQVDLYAGISPEFTDIFSLNEMMQLAEVAWNHKEQVEGRMIAFEKCALLYAVDVLAKHMPPRFLHPAVLMLKQYDAEKGTDLYDSLYTFLKNDRNTAETAKKLCVHRNSMQYRLRRIEEITKVDLDDPDTRLHVWLSCKMLQ